MMQRIPATIQWFPGIFPRRVCVNFKLAVNRATSHAPTFSRIFRRGGALVSALWVLLLWVSPSAFSIWAASSAGACSCCYRIGLQVEGGG